MMMAAFLLFFLRRLCVREGTGSLIVCVLMVVFSGVLSCRARLEREREQRLLDE